MIRVFISLNLALMLAASLVSSAGYASSGFQVRVLDQGQSWQVGCDAGQYAYQIEYLEGDMFVTVEAQFLDEELEVVHTSSHTLVENKRMTAQRTFSAEEIFEGTKASAIRFECGSGKARVSFGPAEAING